VRVFRCFLPLFTKCAEEPNSDERTQAEAYRRVVAQIKEDPTCLGALITAHKVNLLEAARDLFAYLDPLAQRCGEISCISFLNDNSESSDRMNR